MLTPRVSVLISSYNHERWIRSCVDSVLAQTLKPDEIIVYDDGSTDDSIDILRTYGDNIQLVIGDHDPVASSNTNHKNAIRHALQISSGDHIYLLDSDDAYREDHIALYEQKWAKTPTAVMVQGGVRCIDEEDRHGASLWSPEKHTDNFRLAIYRSHHTNRFYPTSALAFERSFLTDYLSEKVPHVIPTIDYHLAFYALHRGPILSLVAEATLHRILPNSISANEGYRHDRSYQNIIVATQAFNTVARHLGQPQIRFWLNSHFWRHLARHFLPKTLGDFFAHLKARRHRESYPFSSQSGQP